MTSESGDSFAHIIDTIEGGYEYLLAYAAQGRHTDRGAGSADGPRERLEAMRAAIEDLPAVARARADSLGDGKLEACSAFFDALERDAAVSVASIKLVLGMADISSQIIDNLNASIHLRALLTDIFLIDEAL